MLPLSSFSWNSYWAISLKYFFTISWFLSGTVSSYNVDFSTVKEQVQKYGTKIYVLISGPLIKENWKNELLYKCTGEIYLKNKDKWVSWLGLILAYASVFIYIYANVLKE